VKSLGPNSSSSSCEIHGNDFSFVKDAFVSDSKAGDVSELPVIDDEQNSKKLSRFNREGDKKGALQVPAKSREEKLASR